MTIDSSISIATKAKLYRSLGDPSRLSILECLRRGPKCVSEIIALTGLSQPNVSGHLSCLRDCGLVEREARGRFGYYRIATPGVESMLREAELAMLSVAALVEACPMYETNEEVKL